VPIDLRPEIEEAPARSGVISRRDIIAKLSRIEDLPEWPEAIYLAPITPTWSTQSRRRSLSDRGTRQGPYHGGRDADERAQKEDQSLVLRVLVQTVERLGILR